MILWKCIEQVAYQFQAGMILNFKVASSVLLLTSDDVSIKYHIPQMHSCCMDFSRIFKTHDDVIKWKHFPRYWPFVRGIHWSPVNSPHNGQWRGALMLSLICARINDWVNNGEAGDLRRTCAHYDVIVMILTTVTVISYSCKTWISIQINQWIAYWTNSSALNWKWLWHCSSVYMNRCKLFKIIQVFNLAFKT